MSSKPPSFPRSSILLLGPNSVNCLLPATLITQADAFLDAHRIEEAVDLAEQQLKRLQSKITVDSGEVGFRTICTSGSAYIDITFLSALQADELRYVFQRIGFQCLTETLFDDAGKHFFSGSLDPRVLVSYYPELCGSLFESEEAVDVFSGVAEHMPPEASIDDIIRNYSPHLAPNTSTAPPTVELRQILKLAAMDMLKVYLRKWRTMRRKEEAELQRVNEVVDTVLAKLYTSAGETTDLLALIGGPNDVVLPEIESNLVEARRYDALCRLYRNREENAKLLDAWSRLIAGDWVDEDVHDPLSSMSTFLSEKRDKALVQEWGVWLLKYDSERALKLLTSLGISKRSGRATSDDISLLRRVREAHPVAGEQLLEYLVLQKRSMEPELHMQLASVYVDQLLLHLEDESTLKLWRAKALSYSSGRSQGPFLSYFASSTPESETKQTRLKTILFLQGSKLYEAEPIRQRIDECDSRKVLSLELAILYGRLGQHHEALGVLVHSLHDSVSAEAYCTLGGGVIPPKTALYVCEKSGLQSLNIFFGAPLNPAKTIPVVPALSREITVDEALKKDLTKILLKVYMSGGEAMAERTAQLVNAQAMNLDVVEVSFLYSWALSALNKHLVQVIDLIPSEWPVQLLSSFVSRSLRRTLHARHEGQIVKAISASQNLAVSEETWQIIREQGAVVEEAVDDDDDDDDGEVVDEKGLAEKVGLALQLNEKVGLHGYDADDGRDAHIVT
ncbi:hypothetical protein PHLCEN_2v8330 [Hermanssonia centrifuga]|uniref:Vacuolar sorting protein 39/Transforming growth factor beta receptor-associated domain-containing protein n=1 Tax=Hermanssonia centrifuga TaxID=98765 RepID=A0A2R6NTX6_9APHY|nr:hypothetical protein PHLCEN_2v8330 [Hermanssonia centrifuga]